MDRSFLSNEQLVKVSREFVCIRTATYEDKEEAKFLERTFVSRPGGTLRNFGYCILSPDGQQKLRRSDRGPNFAYANAAAMVTDLRKIASQYRGRTQGEESHPSLPELKTVRLGINVASCDGLPSVVVVGKNPQELATYKEKLAGVIWDEQLAGKFIYASTSNPADLRVVSGASSRTGILVIKPDTYGIKGDLITVIDPDVGDSELKSSLVRVANSFRRTSKTHGVHVRNGRRTNTIWQTEVPVPDRVRFRSRGAAGRRP